MKPYQGIEGSLARQLYVPEEKDRPAVGRRTAVFRHRVRTRYRLYPAAQAALAILAAGLLLFLYVGERVAITGAGEKLAAEQRSWQYELDRNSQLKAELAALGSLERIEQTARQKLGMVWPQPGQVLVVELPASPSGHGTDRGRMAESQLANAQTAQANTAWAAQRQAANR
ncbi:MAG: cell division protein FtsL [Firmicutes bacterium]|nr:cell division protein FtsL [Bacillota bacterium]